MKSFLFCICLMISAEAALCNGSDSVLSNKDKSKGSSSEKDSNKGTLVGKDIIFRANDLSTVGFLQLVKSELDKQSNNPEELEFIEILLSKEAFNSLLIIENQKLLAQVISQYAGHEVVVSSTKNFDAIIIETAEGGKLFLVGAGID